MCILLLNTQVSMEAIALLKCARKAWYLHGKNHKHSYDISLRKKEKHIFENKIITKKLDQQASSFSFFFFKCSPDEF